MIFSPDRLKEFCPEAPASTVAIIAPTLDIHVPTAGVTTLLRRSHLIAQLAHESAGFTHLIENLNYSAERIAVIWPRLAIRAQELAHRPEALANAAYGGRMGNGEEVTGDGFRYRGRGWLQLTGKNNYRDRGAALKLDLVANPHLAADPVTAVLIALSYWRSRGCNEAADADDVEGVTRLINGGTYGLIDREQLTRKAKLIFTEQPSEGAIA